MSFGLSTSAAANTSIYVSTHGNDNWNGLNSTYISGVNGPKATIKNAVSTVSSGGTVHIASGTYKEHNIIINRNMNIIGENPINTIINGTRSGRIFNITSGVVTIANLRLTGNGLSYNYGGAIYNNGILTVINSIFTNNNATSTFSEGGAIENYGTLTLKEVASQNNTAAGSCYTSKFTYGEGGAIE